MLIFSDKNILLKYLVISLAHDFATKSSVIVTENLKITNYHNDAVSYVIKQIDLHWFFNHENSKSCFPCHSKIIL